MQRQRKGRAYTPQEVLPYVIFGRPRGGGAHHRREFDGHLIKMSTLTLQTFARRGTTCVYCGLEGTRFYKERSYSHEAFHFNLYGVTPEGTEILMNRDHIIPRSWGGTDSLGNLQTTCSKCNVKKGSALGETPLEDAIRLSREPLGKFIFVLIRHTQRYLKEHKHVSDPDAILLKIAQGCGLSETLQRVFLTAHGVPGNALADPE
jgi:hypothetical protein